MVFIDRLIESVIEKRNPSVIGLDTRIEFVPDSIRRACAEEFGANGQVEAVAKAEANAAAAAAAAAAAVAKAEAEALYRFNRVIIDSVKDIVPAVKPQIAFYEIYGSYGAEAFIKTAKYARDNGLMVIADCKRNDIGSTADAYAEAFLGSGEGAYFADALTVNPYLGIDGIEPFMRKCRENGKGIFALVKTSNASSGQLQDMELANGKKVYEHVAGLVSEWASGGGLAGSYGYSSVCAVVGATYPEQMKGLRDKYKKLYFLVPGYGAQGGGAQDAAAAFDSSGLGAVVNASRSVLCAWSHERWGGKYSHEDFGDAARAEALRMKADINLAIGATG